MGEARRKRGGVSYKLRGASSLPPPNLTSILMPPFGSISSGPSFIIIGPLIVIGAYTYVCKSAPSWTITMFLSLLSHRTLVHVTGNSGMGVKSDVTGL